MIQLPVAIGLKVCQEAIQDIKTRHVSLMNCYRKLRFKTFPSASQSLTVCAVVTDGLGEIELSVQISTLATWDQLAAHSWNENFVDPLKEKWFLVRFGEFSFPEPGKYLFTFLAARELIAQATLEVLWEEHSK
jgi:hypothetical protein